MKNVKSGKIVSDETKTALKRKRILALITAIISVVLITWLGFYILKAFNISVDTEGGIESAAENFKSLIEGYGNFGVFVALFIHVLQVIISPLPGEIVEIGMGLCYGWLGGSLICLIGSTVGSFIIVLFVKKLGIRFVELFISVDRINKLKILKDDKNLEQLIFLIYLIPGTPKDMLTFFFGLTNISIPRFLVIQFIARIPSVITSTVGGDFLVEGKFMSALLLFVITGLVSVIGILIYNVINKLNKRKN
jgi:uncharacterized membrane protein YdjX (TVP38/TMEM64 family)